MDRVERRDSVADLVTLTFALKRPSDLVGSVERVTGAMVLVIGEVTVPRLAKDASVVVLRDKLESEAVTWLEMLAMVVDSFCNVPEGVVMRSTLLKLAPAREFVDSLFTRKSFD